MTNKISFNDWQKLDLRVAEIINVEDHPKADKLYILDIDLGGEKRKIVAGIKGHYNKEKLKGKKIVVIANLEPAVLRGIESQGMLLAAVSEDKSRVVLLVPDSDIEPGSKIA